MIKLLQNYSNLRIFLEINYTLIKCYFFVFYIKKKLYFIQKTIVVEIGD